MGLVAFVLSLVHGCYIVSGILNRKGSHMSHRIVSLIASATEIVYALGYGSALVGRSHECDFPDAVEALPICSEPNIAVSGSSREIDDAVKSSLASALSIYTVFPNVLGDLAPSHILTQTQCDVCAVSLKDVEGAVCEILSSQPAIVSLGAMELSGLWDDIRRVARALDDVEAGEQLVEDLQKRLHSISERAKLLPRVPTVGCLEWLEPLMVAGNWVPELVSIAGGDDPFGEPGKHSPYIDWESLLLANPDVLVLMPCGFDIPRTMEEFELLSNHPIWGALKAVQNGHVYVTDGNQYFNRPGPRLVESAEILLAIFADVTCTAETGKLFSDGWKRVIA